MHQPNRIHIEGERPVAQELLRLHDRSIIISGTFFLHFLTWD